MITGRNYTGKNDPPRLLSVNSSLHVKPQRFVTLGVRVCVTRPLGCRVSLHTQGSPQDLPPSPKPSYIDT